MASKILLILYRGDSGNKTQPEWTDSQRFAYNLWGEVAASLGHQLTRAHVGWYKDGVFTSHWAFDENKWVFKNSPIKPDVVYDKCRNYDKATGFINGEIVHVKQEISLSTPMVNEPEFSMLLDSKLNQYTVLQDFLAPSRIVYPGETVSKSSTDPIVLKQFYGSGGHQVVITDDSQVVVPHKMLHQDFIRASNGTTLQDKRLVFIGEAPQYALTRIAKSGSYFTNFHQGATVEFLDLAQESTLLQLSAQILARLQVFKRKVFSLDFLQDQQSGKYYLVEINTMPGLDVFNDHSRQILKDYLVNLTNYLATAQM